MSRLEFSGVRKVEVDCIALCVRVETCLAILDTSTRSEVSLQTKLEAFPGGSFRFLIATKKTSVVGMVSSFGEKGET